jgi:hypothetical protein
MLYVHGNICLRRLMVLVCGDTFEMGVQEAKRWPVLIQEKQ